MLYQLSYASTLKPSKNNRTGTGIASGLSARRGPPLWKILPPILVCNLLGTALPLTI
jgi:hypothetical protein